MSSHDYITSMEQLLTQMEEAKQVSKARKLEVTRKRGKKIKEPQLKAKQQK